MTDLQIYKITMNHRKMKNLARLLRSDVPLAFVHLKVVLLVSTLEGHRWA